MQQTRVGFCVFGVVQLKLDSLASIRPSLYSDFCFRMCMLMGPWSNRAKITVLVYIHQPSLVRDWCDQVKPYLVKHQSVSSFSVAQRRSLKS